MDVLRHHALEQLAALDPEREPALEALELGEQHADARVVLRLALRRRRRRALLHLAHLVRVRVRVRARVRDGARASLTLHLAHRELDARGGRALPRRLLLCAARHLRCERGEVRARANTARDVGCLEGNKVPASLRGATG